MQPLKSTSMVLGVGIDLPTALVALRRLPLARQVRRAVQAAAARA